MGKDNYAIWLDGKIRDTYWYGELTNNYVNIIVGITTLLLLVLLRCSSTLKSFLVLPPLLVILFITKSTMGSLYVALQRTLFTLYALILLRHRMTGRNASREALVKRMKVVIVLIFIVYMLYIEVFAREPLTYFKRINRVPPKLCGKQYASKGFEDEPINEMEKSLRAFTNESEYGKYFGLERSHQFYPHFLEYIKIHNKNLDPRTPIEERRFVVFQTSNDGFGNRIQGLISSFLYAVLTKRAFLVLWESSRMSGGSLKDLFQQPGFEWRFEKAAHLMYDHGWSGDSSKRKKFWVPYCRVCAERRPPTNSSIYSKLLCEDDFGIDSSIQVHWIHSTQYFVPVLAHNPYFRSRVCELFGSSDIYGPLARALLQPSNELKKRITDFRETRFENNQVIGLQIRRLESPNSIAADQLEVFARCAQQLSDSDQTKFFLVTDDIYTRRKLLSMLGEDRLLFIDDEINKLSHGVKNALVENWLFGETDEMITTPYSSFGYAAHGRRSRVPHVVTKSKHCVKMLTSEPCFQYWFGMMQLPCWKDSMLSSDMVNQEECLF